MTHEDHLYEALNQAARELFPDHIGQVLPEQFEAGGHRLMAPVEPCDQCGQRVWLMLPKGRTKPVWLRFGEMVGVDTLFPALSTKRHECGSGEAWSVEAALFVAEALHEWGLDPEQVGTR